MANETQGSPERFGYSWDRFHQLTEEKEHQFYQWTQPIDRSAWRGKRFLDVGCGAGHNSYWAMENGAASCLSIDIDDRSLARAKENLKKHPTAEVTRCSAYDMDRENEFDIAFSIGVVHHIDDPDLAIANMVRATKPGGTVLVWVYGYENLEFYVNVLAPLRKIAFSRLPISVVRWLAYIPTAMLWLVVKTNLINVEYLKMLKDFPFRHLHHIVFDQMLPKIAFHWKRDEAKALLERAGLKDIKIEWINEVSWSVAGTKPE